MRSSAWFRTFLIFLLLTGVVFRFVNLRHKAYWHDEVYTSMRAAGYEGLKIGQELFTNQVIPFGELQKYQQIKPESTLADTINSLAKEDPQHPPLYFAIARSWMQWFGSSIIASRLLAVFFSLLALLLMYALAGELFASHSVALMATTLLALSPFDVLFAQIARQYSLLTATTIGSYWLLVRALQTEVNQPRSRDTNKQRLRLQWRNWGLYALSVALGLYTHPFFGLTVIGQAVYVGLEWFANRPERSLWGQTERRRGWVLRFGVAIAAALILYAPWLWVIITNSQRALSVTSWSQGFPGMDFFAKLWTLSFTSLFFDLYFDSQLVLTFLLRVPILVLIGVSLYALCRYCDRSVWLLILTSILVPFLLLAVPDLLMESKRSTVSRYLISCYPGIQLAVAYFLTLNLATSQPGLNAARKSRRNRLHLLSGLISSDYPLKPWIRQGFFALLVTGSLASLTVSALSDGWWHIVPSNFNADTARRISAASSPIVISDFGYDYTNLGDLISLSYSLNKDMPLLLIQVPTWAKTEDFREQIQGKTAIAFRPSEKLRTTLEQTHGPLLQLSPTENLWQLSQN
ncbi:glycosyltransferase family 39 protein [Leptothermofonsia sp. ETS-13]|uniref:glycosyltransferase family 39 protein n=1 Tax=Leptothermofonsia sp. ETS-13 TaxID=3035696 RepID=UPI003B9FB466